LFELVARTGRKLAEEPEQTPEVVEAFPQQQAAFFVSLLRKGQTQVSFPCSSEIACDSVSEFPHATPERHCCWCRQQSKPG